MADLRYPNYVNQGGTGKGSHTAYAVLCGGVTSTSELQSVASLGSSGQVLTSNGNSSLPTFQDAAGGGSLTFLSTQTASSSAQIDFTSLTSYETYFLTWELIKVANDGDYLGMRMSNNNGSTWQSSGYQAGSIFYRYNSTSVYNKNATDRWVLTGDIDNGTSTNFANGNCYIFNCNVGNLPHIAGNCSFADNSTTNQSFGIMGGSGGTTGANAFRLLLNTGNIASGTFTLYGVEAS